MTDKEANSQTEPETDTSPAGSAEAASEYSAQETADASESGTGALLEQIENLQTEVSQHKERYLRTVADLENFRKRALRDRDDARRNAVSAIVEDLLPVLDNFTMGLQAAKSHEGGEVFAQGFEMILGQLKQVLTQNGVIEIQPMGEDFDPNFHESIAHQPSSEYAEGKVMAVHRVGYRFQERLIRAASVVVSSGPAADASASEA